MNIVAKRFSAAICSFPSKLYAVPKCLQICDKLIPDGFRCNADLDRDQMNSGYLPLAPTGCSLTNHAIPEKVIWEWSDSDPDSISPGYPQAVVSRFATEKYTQYWQALNLMHKL